jgi:hypothetical protein
VSCCERCWRDAHRDPYLSGVEEYTRLLAERGHNGCTPEQQAGPDAFWCPACQRWSGHQHTGECMACGTQVPALSPRRPEGK